VVHLDEIEARGSSLPIREHLGISAFAMYAFRPLEDGTIVADGVEGENGQDELYLVLDGDASFTIDGEDVAAPEGTLVFVRSGSRRPTARGDATILGIGATPGEAYRPFDWGDAWEPNEKALKLYRQERYAEAAESLRDAVRRIDHPGLHYNLACFAALSGSPDEAFEHLRRAVEADPRFRDQARAEGDFAAVRDDPRFEEALR
jgi:tetratricopeptide (TPR) repeat protein